MAYVNELNAAAVHIVNLVIHFSNIYAVFIVQQHPNWMRVQIQKKSSSVWYLSMRVVCCVLPSEGIIRQRIRMNYGKRINPMVQPGSWQGMAFC